MNTFTITYDISQLAGLNWRNTENVLVRLLRFAIVVFIGGMLLLAAIGKLLDNRYFAEILAQWRLFPAWSLLTLGIVTSLGELGLALWLISGWRLAAAAFVAVAFHLCYSIATTITVLRGIRLPDCGCFGILFAHPLDWTMAIEDFALAGVCFFLHRLARRERTSNV